MKNNWLITQTVIGLVVSSFCARDTGWAQPAKSPGLEPAGFPTNELIALELGRADATRDVNSGVLRIPMYGLPSEWSSDFSRILEEKYEVQRYGLGGSLVSQSLSEYARGYSEISEPAINEKFGVNFFERVQAEAKLVYDQRMQEQTAATSAPAPATAVFPAAPSVVAAPVEVPAMITPVVESPAPAVVSPVPARNLAPTKRTYRVKSGDTFWDIARQHHVPVSSLVAANPGVNPGRLQINHDLNVPSAARP
jgi:LysM repeat protein